MWSGSVLTWDGGVVPCCFDKDAAHTLGSIKETSFKEIWKAKNYRDFRQSILNAREEIDICKNPLFGGSESLGIKSPKKSFFY